MGLAPISQAPYLESGAANEASVNEGINRIETLGALYLLDRDLSTPPGSESNGDAYLVNPTGTGGWVNEDNNIAAYYDGYVFIEPHGGMIAFVADEQIWIGYNAIEDVWHPLQRTWSETESFTGEYWRGFKVYEKTIHVGALGNATETTDAHGIESGFKVIELMGTASDGTNHITLPYYHATAGIEINLDADDISITTRSNMTTYFGHVTVLYIKGMTVTPATMSVVVPSVDLTSS